MAGGKSQLVLRHIRMLATAGRSNKLTDRELVDQYARGRDEEAFAALLRRHGPMILRVCQRVLGHPQDAEDVFQATFLVLARKAVTLHVRESIGTWLYEVAYRLAQEARRKRFRQRVREEKVTRRPHTDQLSEITARELVEVLDEELNRLAEKYRAPLVLCCLEGRSGDEAARQLACSLSTLKRRLSRGRELLHVRLTRRGLALSTAALSGLLLQNTGSAAVPAALADATIGAAMAYAATGAFGAVVSTKVLALSEGVLKSMFLTKLKIAAALLLVTVIAGGAGIFSVGLQGGASAEDDKAKSASPGKNASKEKGPSAKVPEPSRLGKVTGRVVQAADSTPVAGADVRMLPRGKYPGQATTRRATTNKNGEFTFNGVEPGDYQLWAFHDNLASRTKMFRGDVSVVEKNGNSKSIVLRLQPGVAVRVKVLCQVTGKPIEGARVRLTWTDIDFDHFTDAKGEVLLQPLTAETYHVQAAAKHCAAEVRTVNLGSGQPAALELRLAPGASVQGTVKDENGRPVSGVGINLYMPDNRHENSDYVVTDAQGNYRLDYLPLGQNFRLYISKVDYLPEWKEFRLDGGAGSLTQLDLALKKRPHGGSVKGVVTDRNSKPIAGAEVVNYGIPFDCVRRGKTSFDGKFSLDNVYDDGSGHHELIVRAKGFAPQRVEFKPGPAAKPAELTVKLEPGHRIKARVVNQAGQPIPRVQVYFAHGNRGDGGSTTTDAQGRFQFDSMPANTPFTFAAEEGYSYIAEIRLPLDGDQEIDVQMKSQGIIKGRVVDAATGKPIPRFNVRIILSEDRTPDEPATGLILANRVSPGEDFDSADGQFVLKDIEDGMPLQVTVNASGCRRQVIRRVVARTEAEAGEVEIRLTAEDPAKLATIRGKLLNHRGQPVRGAELRLIVATDRSNQQGLRQGQPQQRDAYPFNWQMIETGQVDQAPNVLQLQRLTTGADGSFVFERIPNDAEIELVYWGKGIPSARMDHLEKMSPKELANLEVKALAPARITGTIDRKVFPEIGMIRLFNSSHDFPAKVSADGKSFEIDDLPPGKYDLQMFGPPTRVPEQPGAIQYPGLASRPVVLEEGKTETVELGKGDRAP